MSIEGEGFSPNDFEQEKEKEISPEALGAEYIEKETETQNTALSEKGLEPNKFQSFMTGLSMVVTGSLGIAAGKLAYETVGTEPSQLVVAGGLTVGAIGMLTISTVIGKQLGLLQKR